MSKLSKKQIEKIMDDYFYIIVDTREKDNHIQDALQKYNIKYIRQKVDYGDYSAMIKKCDEYGINEDIVLDVSVERKRSLDELANNLGKENKRFKRELQRCVDNNGNMIIMIEGENYSDIASANYRSKLTPKQYLGILHSIYPKYGVPFIFIDYNDSPLFTYNFLKYYAKNFLKNKE